MSKRAWRKLISGVLASLFLLLFATITANLPKTEPTKDSGSVEITEAEKIAGYVSVSRVIDGDTVVVNVINEDETIRLIGIDTPESVDPRKPVQCFALEASEHLKTLVRGRKMKLVIDPSQQSEDKYDRWLRYLILDDGTDVNKKMIEDGYAYEYTYDRPYIRQAEYRAAQEDAKKSKRGLWASDTCNGVR